MASNTFFSRVTDTFRPIKRRTLAAYTRLFRQPNYLFGRGTRTTIFPNGEREIWIKNADGTASFAIRASDGPAGFSITILSHVGSLQTDAHVMTRSDYRTHMTDDVREITFVAYYRDEYSQQFKRWYAADAAAGRDENTETMHPEKLGLTPRTLTPEPVDNV